MGATRRLTQMTDVRRFGAKGTGVVDDTTAIHAAIAATPDGGSVYFPTIDGAIGQYLHTGLTITKWVTLVGDTRRGSYLILAAGALSATKNVKYNAANGYFVRLAHLNIFNQSNGGGDCVYFDLSASARTVNSIIIEDCNIGPAGTTGYGINVDNSDLTSASEDGYWDWTIRNNYVQDGVLLLNSGDSLRVENNLITGRNCGIDVKSVSGAVQNTITGNSITSSAGAIKVRRAGQLLIGWNQLETPTGGTGVNDAVIDVNGDSAGLIYNTKIIGNNINAAEASSLVDYGVKVDQAIGTVIQDNYIVTGAVGHVSIGSNATHTRLRQNHYVNGSFVISAPTVANSGSQTEGLWIAINNSAGGGVELQSSWAATGGGIDLPYYRRTGAGEVLLRGGIAGGTTTGGTTLFTLPTGFRPAGTIFVVCQSSSTTGILQITSAGVVSIISLGGTSIGLHGISFKVAEP